MGTMKVFGACAQAGVRKIVLRSSTAVYGAHPSNPAFLTEDHPLRGSRRYGYTRDMVEIEAFCNGFRRQMPETILTILRFPGIIGPHVDTPMNRFLRGAWAPVLLGFDPRMQLIHKDDALEALAHAVVHDVPGVFNVAAEGVFPLMKILSLTATLPVPIFHPLAYWGTNLLGGTGLRLTDYVPIELDYIRYPWVADLAKMEAELGFVPTYTAEEALRELAEQKRMKRYASESTLLARGEEHLRAVIERRRRAKAPNEPTPAANPRQEEEKDNE
jgi:UDP-glucose 4-epimerase